MTTFDDVYEKDWNTYVKIYELKELLISKLEKYGIEVEHETPFADLIHMVNDIPSVIYDVRGNVMPADELKAIDGEHSLMRFEIDLWKRIKYYNKWLRYYLILKGVSVETINQVSTLKEHILLIDRIDRVMGSILTVRANNPFQYATNNVIRYQIVTTSGEPINDGYMIVMQNGQMVKKVPVGETLAISPASSETQTYEIYYEGTNKYLESNHVELVRDVVAGDIKCTIDMVNINPDSKHYMSDNKGYTDDTWLFSIATTTENGIPLRNVPFDIYIGDYLYMEGLETDENGFFAFEMGNIDEHGDISIYVQTNIEDNSINNVRERYDITILYEQFKIVQSEDYTGKNSYTFEIVVQDENDGYLYSNMYNGWEICYHFIDLQNCIEIQNGCATFTYSDNIEPGIYPIEWSFDGESYEDNVIIKSNFTLPDTSFFYLNDYPQIKYAPNGIIEENAKVGVQILHVGDYLYSEAGDDTVALEMDLEEVIEEYNAIGFFKTDENGYIILPDELRLVTDVTLLLTAEFADLDEQVEYSYEMSLPFAVEKIEYVRQTHVKYKVTVFDKEDFDTNAPISDYISINKKSGISLDYVSYVDTSDNDVYYIYVNAVLADNPRLMGKNYFNVEINGYRHQEDFKLYDIVYRIIDPENFTIGNNEILVECYEDALDTLAMIGDGIDLEGFVDNEGIAIMRGAIDKPGTYTVNICGTGACDTPVCEEHEIVVPKWHLELVNFGNWDNPLAPDSVNNHIVIEFAEHPVEETILPIIYWDYPNNSHQIGSAQCNLDEATTIPFNLNSLPPGRHTIYVQYNGSSEYYDSFLYQAEANVLMPTHLYAEVPEEIEVGESINLSLLTLDYNNNIVSDGSYVVNNVEYGMDDEIVLTPDALGEFRIEVQYEGIDIYDDCHETYIVNVLAYVYDYYVSSEIGDNGNHGRDPSHPVHDLSRAIEISNATDTICAMAGETSKESIERDLILLGYNRDAIEDIHVTLHQLAPHTTLIVDNIMLDTGNGFVPITERTTFVNNSDGYIDIDTIPHEEQTHDEQITVTNVEYKSGKNGMGYQVYITIDGLTPNQTYMISPWRMNGMSDYFTSSGTQQSFTNATQLFDSLPVTITLASSSNVTLATVTVVSADAPYTET